MRLEVTQIGAVVLQPGTPRPMVLAVSGASQPGAYGGTVSFGLGATPVEGTIMLDGWVAGARTITAVHANGGTAGGSIAARLVLRRGGTDTPIDGLDALLASGATAAFTAAPPAALQLGDALLLEITAVTGVPADAWFTITGTAP